jgi:DNA-binding transcriptional ArsR family regulator
MDIETLWGRPARTISSQNHSLDVAGCAGILQLARHAGFEPEIQIAYSTYRSTHRLTILCRLLILNHMVEQLSEPLDAVFHALADPTRRAMLRSLGSGERTVTELASPFRMSLAAASKHVKTLERAGLVRRTIQGRTHVCRLDPEPLATAQAWFRFYERFWNERLDALEALFDTDKET